MAYISKSIMDKWEVIRRWHCMQSTSGIAANLGYDRKTVRGYIRLAVNNGLSRDRPLPPKEEILEMLSAAEHSGGRSAGAQLLLKQHLAEIDDLINDKQLGLRPKIAFEVLLERHDLAGKVSYSSFKRFVRRHKNRLDHARSTCRMEVPAGSEVQIDYAKVGILYDPLTQRRRTLSVFIGTLGFSRHKYPELVFSQDQKSFVGSHVRMFEYFGGVPERVRLDNLKTGVIKPDLYDPSMNRSYQELANYYGCFLDPCRVAHPKDKGKVERDVQTIRQAARKLMVLHPTADIVELNRYLRKWCIEVYGARKHGTTQELPYQVFRDVEHPALRALPLDPFEIAEWKEATVHPDHYIQFNRKTYSVPDEYIGRTLWVRGTERILQIFHDEKMIRQHAITSSYRHTNESDFPANVRAVLGTDIPVTILAKAQAIGPHFHTLLRSLLEIHAFINLRKAQGLLALADQFDRAIMETAAVFAIEHRLSMAPEQFKLLLEKLHAQECETTAIPLSQQSLEFVRDISYFISTQETSQ
jgi:transposase